MLLTTTTIRDILAHELKGGDGLKTVAERIKEARLAQGKKVEEVATACGITVSAVQMYECGQRIPRDEIKIKMAECLKTTVQDLFF